MPTQETGTFRRSDTCDAVVVGAGIVGAATAAQLAQAGMEVAVLEAQKVAGGATGRSAGMIINGLSNHYQWAIETFGREQAKTAWTLTSEGRARLIDAAIRLGVPLQQSGSLTLAVTESEAEELTASANLLQQDGFTAEFSNTDPLDRGFQAALRQPGDVMVNMAALTQAMLSSAPIAIHTNTEVYDLEPEGEMVRVWAQKRTVRCRVVVLAVDGYAPSLDRTLAQWIAPGRGLVVTTEPLSELILTTPCRADHGYEYARPLPDGRLLLGAWRRPRPGVVDSEVEMSLREGLTRFIEHYFPETTPHITDRRSGVMGFTTDGLPIIGCLPHFPQVTFAAGLGGWGLDWAFIIAERLTEWILKGTGLGLLSVDRLI